MKKMKLFALVAIASMATVALFNSDALAASGCTKFRGLGSRVVDDDTKRCCFDVNDPKGCVMTDKKLSTCPQDEC